LLVAYLSLVLPLTGRARYRSLTRRAATDPEFRSAVYWSSILRQWLLTGLALIVLVGAGARFGDLGLSPRAQHLREIVPGLLAVTVLGAGLGLLLRRWPRARARVLRPVAALLPVTTEERRLFVAVAITAGIAEEVLFRGFLLVYLTEVFPRLPLGAAMLVAAALFGLAHAYQGVLGVLLTGVAGYWLAGLYVLTGSLLLPVIVHALVDLRLLLVLPARSGQ
jgi:membrane protease YdiL (CAAX protease family)